MKYVKHKKRYFVSEPQVGNTTFKTDKISAPDEPAQMGWVKF